MYDKFGKKINGREEINEKIVYVNTIAREVNEASNTHSTSYVSLKNSIEKYLNMKHMFPYIQFSHPRDQNIIDSCLNGLAYRTLYNNSKKLLAMNVYVDDVSMNTAIGSYSDNNNITNVSYSIPNVVRQRSTPDTIQPFVVTLSENAKKDSYKEILKIIKKEFKDLKVRVGTEIVPCVLFMLKGNNVAVNAVLKLSGSFSPLSLSAVDALYQLPMQIYITYKFKYKQLIYISLKL
uniref:THUMP domain-containing protein n=1 Tax=Strongyloides papillosus TaxID=174720 RepID=A0A0N5B1U9_STREA